MSGTSSTPIVLGFVLGIIPFALWTAWLLRQERAARTTSLATSNGQARQLLLSAPSRRLVEVRAGSVCQVEGSTAFTPSGEALVCSASAEGVRPRWRPAQTAA